MITLLYGVKRAGGDPFSNPDFKQWREEAERVVGGNTAALAALNEKEAYILAQAGFENEAKALLDVIGRQGGSDVARKMATQKRVVDALSDITTHIREIERG